MTDKEIKADRAKSYGDAKKSFSKIAALWETYLDVPIEAHDVAICMTLLKINRMTTAKGESLTDSFQDARIYLELAEEVWS